MDRTPSVPQCLFHLAVDTLGAISAISFIQNLPSRHHLPGEHAIQSNKRLMHRSGMDDQVDRDSLVDLPQPGRYLQVRSHRLFIVGGQEVVLRHDVAVFRRLAPGPGPEEDHFLRTQRCQRVFGPRFQLVGKLDRVGSHAGILSTPGLPRQGVSPGWKGENQSGAPRGWTTPTSRPPLLAAARGIPAKSSRDRPFDRLRACPERCEGTGLTAACS